MRHGLIVYWKVPDLDDVERGDQILAALFGHIIHSGCWLIGERERDVMFERETPFTQAELDEATRQFTKAGLTAPRFSEAGLTAPRFSEEPAKH